MHFCRSKIFQFLNKRVICFFADINLKYILYKKHQKLCWFKAAMEEKGLIKEKNEDLVVENNYCNCEMKFRLVCFIIQLNLIYDK